MMSFMHISVRKRKERGGGEGSSMIRGSTAIGKEYFKNVPESELYFYIACLRNIKMLLYLRSINILLDRGT